MRIFIILGIPLVLIAISFLFKKSKTFGVFNALGHLFILLVSIDLAREIIRQAQPVMFHDFFYADYLSVFFTFTVSLINFASSVCSIEYITKDVSDGNISEKKAFRYYQLFNLFVFTMFFVTFMNNLGMIWIAIEMTTLVSAFLVGFYNNKKSIEAAWKYIIICSVGLAFALLGTILFYYTASHHAGMDSLNWLDMLSVANKMDPGILKIAFIFILVGYGTKAGLVPMHTWLPDAHSQALAPISALLSGVLLKTAIFAILRFTIIINKCIGCDFSSNLLLFFGLLSLGISAAFILIQKDVKRLLAYSSVEHIGIISIGLGFGNFLGVYGALFHIFNHAVTKSLIFLGIGDVVKKYKTSNMNIIRGIISVMPFTGIVLILGVFALAGAPPGSIFMSELLIIISGFKSGYYFSTIFLLFFISIIFGAMIYHFSKIIFGKKPEVISEIKEPISLKLVYILLFVFIVIWGFNMPDFFHKLLVASVEIIRG